MRKNHADITIVLDRSGSMASVASDTIGGFNNFVAGQKSAPGTATLTLNQFDVIFDVVYSAMDIASVPKLTDSTFDPRGPTALYDAIGRSINSLGERLSATPESERPDKVIMVIITDGLENSSRRFSAREINDMITHQTEKYQWEFVFLGANQDAILSAKGIGIAGDKAMTYAHNAVGTQEAFASLASNTSSLRAGSKADMSWTMEDRKKQNDAGAPGSLPPSSYTK